jgi:type IV pilus assembly protein PilM
MDEFVSEEGERMRRVLLVAGHREMITSYVDVATKAGLKPIGIDLDPFAVLRAMGTTSAIEPGNEVLVDVGAGVTNIVVHEAGMPTFVRILVMGGNDITDALASGLGIGQAEAEAAKRGAVVVTQTDVAAHIATEQADQFIDEIRSSLDYYQAQTGGARISNVVLTGGGSTLRGLPERMANVLGLPVELGNPFGRWQVKNTVYGEEDLQRVGPSLATAVGLALGGLE